MQLVKELVQPLLTLRSSATCPTHLHLIGRLPITQELHCIGKHFPYKSVQYKWYVVCSKKASPSTGKGNDKKPKFFVQNVKLFFASEDILKCNTRKHHISPWFFGSCTHSSST